MCIRDSLHPVPVCIDGKICPSVKTTSRNESNQGLERFQVESALTNEKVGSFRDANITDTVSYTHLQAIFAEAKDSEKKAREDKSAVFLRPMTAFERKCIHLALANSETVTTESSGTGEHRKVIVKPKGDLE